MVGMHATERESAILDLLSVRGFISFRELEQKLEGSPATIRRDLERLDAQGRLIRVRGGAKALDAETPAHAALSAMRLGGTPFAENVTRNLPEKKRIGAAAAAMCGQGEGIMIDGGSTTLQMCPHLEGLGLQVLTNSLHIVLALTGQNGTRVLVPGGAVFPEQNIILPMFGEDLTPAFHAPKLFMGAAAIGACGLMQDDVVLVASERRFIERAEEVIVLADASKFDQSSGSVVCALEDIDALITDDRITDKAAAVIEAAGVNLVVA
ncbi:DeoR family transcriptional regulator [Hyphomonas johnsonii MHS-2]|uniref:DeoR family transcriptional regulator n=2 Tax=Hyphomonas johnsonii TaxID=81031 RepID=A0A059FS80_9PROT|nr:DeoR family transcriptional regulator [Hyphomonas johnsonii MHS-2]